MHTFSPHESIPEIVKQIILHLIEMEIPYNAIVKQNVRHPTDMDFLYSAIVKQNVQHPADMEFLYSAIVKQIVQHPTDILHSTGLSCYFDRIPISKSFLRLFTSENASI